MILNKPIPPTKRLIRDQFAVPVLTIVADDDRPRAYDKASSYAKSGKRIPMAFNTWSIADQTCRDPVVD